MLSGIKVDDQEEDGFLSENQEVLDIVNGARVRRTMKWCFSTLFFVFSAVVVFVCFFRSIDGDIDEALAGMVNLDRCYLKSVQVTQAMVVDLS